MPSKAKKLVGLGRTTAVKTFTRNNNLSIEPRSERQARTLSVATNRGCVACLKAPLFLLCTLALALSALFALSATSAFAAPYKYEKAQSEELSKTVPGGAFAEPFGLTFDAAGNLLVMDRQGNAGNGVIDKFNPESVFQTQLGVGLLSPYALSVAVDDVTGDVYIADSNASEVFVLSPAGALLSKWTGKNTPTGTFGGGCCYVHVAVDNSGDASKGDVYVMTTQGEGEVDVFEPQNANKEEGKFLGKLEVLGGFKTNNGDTTDGVAVNDSSGPEAGEVYVVDSSRKVVDRFSAAGEFEVQITGPSSGETFEEPVAVAVDGATGNVFVIDNLGFGTIGKQTAAIDEFGPSGELLNQIGETGKTELFGKLTGVAVQPTGPDGGEVYVADAAKKVVDGFAELVPAAPLIEGEGVQQVTGDSASFVAEIDPRGAPTEYHVEYGPCAGIESCASSPYPSVVPVPDGSLGAEDFTTHSTPSFHVQGLSAGTTYHFRVVAHNEVNGKVEVAEGEERTFTTQGAGGEFALPDDRAWELVSPPDKHGGVLSQLSELGVIQAAVDGDAISYGANAPTEASSQGDAGSVQVLSTRTAGGWSSRDIATPHEAATGNSLGTAPEYRFFNEELSSAVVQPFGRFNPALSDEASEQTPYLHSLTIPAEACTSSSSCFVPLVTAGNVEPAGAKFGEELVCEENNSIADKSASVCGPRFEGASPDASHVVLRSAAPLIAGVPRNELYEWSGGRLSLMSLLAPNKDGEELPAPTNSFEEPVLGAQYGSPSGTARRAISSDGSRVFFESNEALYMRDTALGKSLQLDAPQAGCVPCKGQGGGGRFQIASTDGSRVFFTDTRHLTEDSGAKSSGPVLEPDLYECEIGETAGKPTCALTDVTPLAGGESANVQGDVLGASEDGYSIYFVADGALSGSEAQSGDCVNGARPAGATCNLYHLSQGRGVSLVAVLSGADAKDWTQAPEDQPTRVSPNGQYLSFMSERPLTGYDNADAVSGKPDAELFLYDAAGAGSLSCASCDPSGARPVGVEYGKLESGESEALPAVRGEWEDSGWVAALPPRTSAIGGGEPTHQPDYLSDSGRLFFNGLDALVPQDINGTGDVYEYEPQGYTNEEGTQQCTEATATFATRAGGCIGLISSGTSVQSSAFLDVSKSGGDVFFLTTSKLTPEDIDTKKDVYDAHECTVKSPCIPPAAAAPPPCNTEASCKPSPTPPPGIFGAPPSATFNGAGNLTPPAVVKPKAKPLTRAQKLAKALATCHRDKRKAKRSACEKSAHKQFGLVKKSKK
jgi:DNA-binding beta-propeller fold protein YncE